ncbi:MAG: hypothetical protein N2V74_00120 [Candidatus Methanospirare jalkutatii]|nr:MAG: hypothetical protein N2V74_00120 [Candidatus Methanospirare jalkutatii]
MAHAAGGGGVLKRVFSELSAFLNERKVVSEGELRLKIGECLSALSDAEMHELEKNLGIGREKEGARGKAGERAEERAEEGTEARGETVKSVEEIIFRSITTREKISVFSPDCHTKINYQGEIFYCLPTHKFFAEELEQAFLRWSKIRSAASLLSGVVEDFLRRCGYSTRSLQKEAECEVLEAEKAHGDRRRKLRILILPSIKFVPRFLRKNFSEESENTVIAVPTERTPAPFISFFREHAEEFPSEWRIWVVDTERKAVNPFLGREEDEEIERNFENPMQARKALSVWMRKAF